MACRVFGSLTVPSSKLRALPPFASEYALTAALAAQDADLARVGAEAKHV